MGGARQPARSPSPERRLGRWAAAITIAATAAFLLVEWHGRSSRLPFQAPAQIRGLTAASVGNAADAFVLWRGSGVNGRRLVLLTGRWSTSPGDPTARAGGEIVNPSSALYWAAHTGVVRGIDVVMPPAPFEARRVADAGHKVFQPEDGAYRHDLHGMWLRFSLPRAFAAPAEPTLVLVEPTFFAAGAPTDPLAWLSMIGARFDLALVTLDDPAANDEQRRAAAQYARATKLRHLNVRAE